MNTYYAKKRRQYNFLIKRINRLVNQNKWNALTTQEQEKLGSRLKRLYKSLSGIFNQPSLVKAMGVAALVVGFAYNGNAQSFNTPVANPFSLTTKGLPATPEFADIDNDGDLDMFDFDLNYATYEVNIAYHENTGTKNNPVFAAKTLAPFNLNTDSLVLKSDLADFDNDGDLDLLNIAYGGNFVYYNNSGDKDSAHFDAAQFNIFGLTKLNQFGMANSVDLDGDGDLDLMVTDYDGDNFYFQNTGSKSNPNFAASTKNPFGLTSLGYLSIPSFSDVDGDGDYDLMHGEEYGNFQYFENTGSKTNPSFATATNNPFSLMAIPSGVASLVVFADLDGDSDDDLMVSDYYGDFYYYENASGIGIGESEFTAFNLFPNPASSQTEILFDNMHDHVSVELIDIAGRALTAQVLENTNRVKIDISEYPAGIYFMKINADGKKSTKKLIIQ